LFLRGGKIATSTGVLEADVAMDQGKIVGISKETNLPKADTVLNVSGLFVLLGIVDATFTFAILDSSVKTSGQERKLQLLAE